MILIPQVFYMHVILHTISKVFLKIFFATSSKGNTALRALVEQLYCFPAYFFYSTDILHDPLGMQSFSLCWSYSVTVKADF